MATITGTESEDTLIGGRRPDSIVGLGGDDNIFGYRQPLDQFDGPDTLDGGTGDDNLHGGFGADWLYGGPGADNLQADAGKDHLRGGPGDDLLNGGEGRDLLVGGRGSDELAGRDGPDKFIFSRVYAQYEVDTIADFAQGEDHIVLKNEVSGPNHDLTFIGMDAFSGSGRAEFRYEHAGDIVVILLDADGDASADLQIELHDFAADPIEADFIIR